MSRVQKPLRISAWLAACATTIACNALFDIQEPIERPSTDDQACLLSSSCPPGQVCLFQVCSPPCDADVDCPSAGSRCLHTAEGTACVSESLAGCAEDQTRCPSGTLCSDDACYAECDGARSCADGHGCVQGACKGPSGVDGTNGGMGGASSAPGGASAGGASADGDAGASTAPSQGGAGEGGGAPSLICTARKSTCENNTVKTCNEDGTAYLDETQCTDEQTCKDDKCVPLVCGPGRDYCAGSVVRSCAADGLSSTSRTICIATQYCDDTTATCKGRRCPNLYFGTNRFSTAPLRADFANDGVYLASDDVAVDSLMGGALRVYNHGSDDSPSSHIELYWVDPADDFKVSASQLILETDQVVPGAALGGSDGEFSINWGHTFTTTGRFSLLARLKNNDPPTSSGCTLQSYDSASPPTDPQSAVHNIQVIATSPRRVQAPNTLQYFGSIGVSSARGTGAERAPSVGLIPR